MNSTIRITGIFFSLFLAFTVTAQDETLNYRDADIRAFIEDVALESRKTFIIDPAVTGKINLVSSAPIRGEMLFETFLSVLRVNGFAAVPTSTGAYRIVKTETGAQDAVAVGETVSGDRLVTRVFTVRYTDPVAIQAAIKPYIASEGHSFARGGLPLVVVTDFADNLVRIAEIIQRVDKDRSVIRTLRLKHTSATEMAEVAAQLTIQAGTDGANEQFIQAIPVKGSNTLILKGLAEVIEQYQPILETIDANNAQRGDMRVIRLKYASAEALLPLLDGLAKSLEPSASETSSGQQYNISSYTAANAIVINAGPDLQQRLEEVIYALDIPRAQVLVEAIVVEVSETASKELGLQYILAGGDSSSIPFTVANYSNTAPNVLAATGAIVVNDGDGDGNNSASDLLKAAAVDSFLGLNGFGIGAAGRTSGGGVFGVILNALANDTDSNILSTPSVMTLDNESASFLAGQEIPISTGEALGSANTNPFRTIERKDVGIQLEVKPQINEGDEIRLVIRQEVSSIAGPVSAGSGELITNKREINTTVRVASGEVVVLGGLIQQSERISVDKVPFLGDIPLIGRAFRSDAKLREKTNLMIFLRPTIVRTEAERAAMTERKYDYIRGRAEAAGSKISVDEIMQDVIGAENPGSEK